MSDELVRWPSRSPRLRKILFATRLRLMHTAESHARRTLQLPHVASCFPTLVSKSDWTRTCQAHPIRSCRDTVARVLAHLWPAQGIDAATKLFCTPLQQVWRLIRISGVVGFPQNKDEGKADDFGRSLYRIGEGWAMSHWLRLACVSCCLAVLALGCGEEGGPPVDQGETHVPQSTDTPSDTEAPPNPSGEDRLPDRFRK